MDKQLAETNFIIYKNEDGDVVVDVVLKDETIWITQKGMAELFGVNVPAISKHLDNIYTDKELTFESTVSKMEIVRKEGNRNVKRNLEFYNLDAIIAVGYRVNSKKATQFRIWATQILKDYMIKGFVFFRKLLYKFECFLLQFLPNDPTPNSISDAYRRFKLHPLPVIEPEHIPISFVEAKAIYEAKYHKPLKPVFRHKGKDYPSKGTICPHCGATHEYLSFNNGQKKIPNKMQSL